MMKLILGTTIKLKSNSSNSDTLSKQILKTTKMHLDQSNSIFSRTASPILKFKLNGSKKSSSHRAHSPASQTQDMYSHLITDKKEAETTRPTCSIPKLWAGILRTITSPPQTTPNQCQSTKSSKLTTRWSIDSKCSFTELTMLAHHSTPCFKMQSKRRVNRMKAFLKTDLLPRWLSSTSSHRTKRTTRGRSLSNLVSKKNTVVRDSK